MMLKTGTGTGIDVGGDDDFSIFMNNDRAPTLFLFFYLFRFPLFLFPFS